jgi:acyl-CoA reductase-like NAD-dependent aldehyde dehydrogenase
VVLKPAPQTPLTTLRIGELLRPILPRGAASNRNFSSDLKMFEQWETWER